VGEDPRLLDPPGLADKGGGGAHVLALGPVAGEPQPDVCLDRGREVAGAVTEVGPGAVGALLGVDPGGGALGRAGLADAEELPQEQVLGVHGHVRLQLALPPAVGALQGEQALPGAEQRLLDWVGSGDLAQCLAWLHSGRIAVQDERSLRIGDIKSASQSGFGRGSPIQAVSAP
jgi:hypothetical protein